MREAIGVELLKLRKSPVSWAAGLLVLIVGPALCWGFVSVVEDGKDGILAAKLRTMVSGTGWEAYTGLLGQVIATAFFVGVGVVVIWCFGREFSDRTIASLFSLPTTRGTIAMAKLSVLLIWSGVLSVVLVAVAAGLGWAAFGMPDMEILGQLAKLLAVAGLTAMLALPLAIPASMGRGYLPGIGILILVLMTAQVAVLFGSGAWYPFAAAGLWAVAGQSAVVSVSWQQLAMVPLTALVCAWSTIRWWNGFELT